jgi:hypothetical protein
MAQTLVVTHLAPTMANLNPLLRDLWVRQGEDKELLHSNINQTRDGHSQMGRINVLYRHLSNLAQSQRGACHHQQMTCRRRLQLSNRLGNSRSSNLV